MRKLIAVLLVCVLSMGTAPDWQDQGAQTIKVRLFLRDTDGSSRTTGTFYGFIAGADTSLARNKFALTVSGTSGAWESSTMGNGAKIRSGWYDIRETGGVDSMWIDQIYLDGYSLAKYAVDDTTLATASVGTRVIATDGVNSAEIADGSVGAAEVATDAVGSDEISDSITLTGTTTAGADSSSVLRVYGRVDLEDSYKEFTFPSGTTTQTFTWAGVGDSWRFVTFWIEAPSTVRSFYTYYNAANQIGIDTNGTITAGTKVGVIAIRPSY